jgi:hypothetical protein
VTDVARHAFRRYLRNLDDDDLERIRRDLLEQMRDVAAERARRTPMVDLTQSVSAQKVPQSR